VLTSDKLKLSEEKLIKNDEYHNEQIRRYDEMLALSQNDDRSRMRSER
jgi:hypothetical protein